MKTFGLSVILTGALATPGLACDLCAIYSANQAHGDIGTGFFTGFAEQFSHFGTVQVDGHKVSNPTGQYLDSSISQVFAGYNFDDRFSLQLNVPLIYRSFKRPEGTAIDRGTEFGIGDIALIGGFVPYHYDGIDTSFRWSLLGGLKLPTGSTDRLKEEFNEIDDPEAPPSGIHGHDLTLGTGSYDGLVGTSIYTRWKRAFLIANVQYALRTKGDFDYRFANDLTWSGGPGAYLLLTHQYTVAVQAVVSGENKAKDIFQGASAEDTGVTAVYLGPQITATWKDKLSATVGVDLPISIDNTALQTVPDYRVRAGFTWHF
ncbi:MAG: hypothetical protein JWR69_3612 [Pedosphaera sp.]|nr:hypothetical protein [Pedosphaera sp.]